MSARLVADDRPNESFYAPGLQAELGAIGERCWFQVQVEPEHDPQADAIVLEVLHQPRDEAGLPCGSACVVYEATWPLRGAVPGARIAFGWLPRGVHPGAARRYHYRATPIKMQ